MLKKIFAVSALSLAALGVASAPAMAGTGHGYGHGGGYGYDRPVVDVYAPTYTNIDADLCGVIFVGSSYCK